MELLRFDSPEQRGTFFLMGALAMGLGALSMTRPSPPRDVPAAAASTLYGSALASLSGGLYAEEVPALDVEEAPLDLGEEYDDAPPLVNLPAPEVELVGTSVSANPRLHRVAFRYPDRTVPKFYHLGDRVDHHTVEQIQRGKVVLRAPDGTRWTYQVSTYPEDELDPVREGGFDEPMDDR